MPNVRRTPPLAYGACDDRMTERPLRLFKRREGRGLEKKMLKRTPLHDYHAQHGKMVEFAGYDMPVWYTGIMEEHMAVRNHAGIFDVSHMGRIIVKGPEAGKYTEALVPTRSASQPIGKSFYTLLLNPQGGIIDDLIIIKRAEDDYLFVVNAANKEKDALHMASVAAKYDVKLDDITDRSTMIAIQGPESFQALQGLTDQNLSEIKRYNHVLSNVGGSAATITRTGYTGEDGFEIILYDSGVENNSVALSVWNELAKRAKPAGLGSRDSLRTEAGLPLYGSDIDDTTNPIEADLAWVISKEKTDYVGSDSIATYLRTPAHKMRRGIILEDKIPRRGFAVNNEAGEKIGYVTSGTFSPIAKKGIALAYVDSAYAQIGQGIKMVIRDAPTQGRVVKPPFYDEKVYGWKRLASSANPTSP
jgi:aminomethyltransferase